MLKYLKIYAILLGYGFLASLFNIVALTLGGGGITFGLYFVFLPILLIAALLATPIILMMKNRGVIKKMYYIFVGGAVPLSLMLACNAMLEMKAVLSVWMMLPCALAAGYMIARGVEKDIRKG